MRILHVEDNAVDVDLTQRQLAKLAPDMQLQTASTLAAARQCLQTPSDFDAVLVDLKLPDGSGLELVADIRERGLALAVVVLTGSGDPDAAVTALQAGANDYQIKGHVALARLATTLRSAHQRVQASSGQRAKGLRVLYAEHNAADVDLARRHLVRHAPHIHLTVVPSADAALAKLPTHAQSPCDFDVLLLDYRLPGLDALEAIKALRQDRGLTELPIVVVSGQGNEEVAIQAMQLGVDDYISKHTGYLYELPATLEKVHQQAQLRQSQGHLQEVSERLTHVLASSPVVLFTLRLGGDAPQPTWISSNLARVLGHTTDEALTPGWWAQHVHPDDLAAARGRLATLAVRRQLTREYRLRDAQQQYRWLQESLSLQPGDDTLATGIWRDVTETKQAEQVQNTRIAVLDGLVANLPLTDILKGIATRLEALQPEMMVSILVMDTRDGCLHTGAAPSLPDFFNDAVNGLVPAVGQGSCGSSAALREPVIVEDVLTHPYWSAYVDLTVRAGLRACWSIPFLDAAGLVLGTFGIYYAHPNTPTQPELALIGEFARMAGLAVARVQADTTLRQAAAVFESTREGVVVTDLTPRILSVNRAYCDISGYTEAEVLGRDPSVLRSGRQDAAYYQALWASLREVGHWQGEIWNRRKNGELYPQLLTLSTVRDPAGLPTHYVGVMTDISQLKQSEARLAHLAHYDPLTDLPNRLLVQSRLAHALERADRSGQQLAVLFIDLDRFKNINDSLGHPVGDELLAALAHRLRERLRDDDTLGRLGGDEFVVLLEGLEGPADAALVAQSLIQLLEHPFDLASGHEVFIGASIGISMYPNDGASVTELIKNADAAMYQAKEQGRNTVRFYTPSLSQAANERLEMEARLRRALANHEMLLHYQPQMNTASGAVVGCEALVRWQPPGEALISPLRFIPLAEETGLIVPLGEWVLRTACQQAKAWLDAGWPPLLMAVNLSARQLQQRNLVELVAQVLRDTGLPPAHLKLELTESMIMGRGEQAIALMHALKALGVSLSIDDFGTGYSSLAYLKRFPINELKIDQGFVRDIPNDASDAEIATTIIAMAHNLKLQVMAEGVETPEQLAFLTDQGCQAYQGYLLSKPVPAEAFTPFLEQVLKP